MAPCEVNWRSDRGRWFPDDIIGKPPEWFVFSMKYELRFLSRDHMIEGEPLPDRKFLLPRYYASYNNPYGERLLSRCFWPVTFKKGGFKFWAMFTEKYGMPWAIGKLPPAKTEDDRRTLLGNLSNMVQDACAVINNDESVELVESGGKSASSDVYESLIRTANAEISKTMVGQTLTTELVGGGSLAATQAHMEVRADIAEADQKMIYKEFNKLLQWICELNYGDIEAPEFSFYEEQDIRKDLADRDRLLSEQNVRFTKTYYQRAYGFADDEIEVPEHAVPEPAEFAEPKETILKDIEDAADGIIGDAADAFADGVGGLLKAKDFKELQQMLSEGKIDFSQFRELLARTLFVSGALGYHDARAEK
jgi:phage gp29-like protein